MIAIDCLSVSGSINGFLRYEEERKLGRGLLLWLWWGSSELVDSVQFSHSSTLHWLAGRKKS